MKKKTKTIVIATISLFCIIIYLLFNMKYIAFKIHTAKIDANKLIITYELENYSLRKYYLHPPSSSYTITLDDVLNIKCTNPFNYYPAFMSIYGFAVPEVTVLPPLKTVTGTATFENNAKANYKTFDGLRISFLILNKKLESGTFLREDEKIKKIKEYNEFLKKYGERIYADFPLSGKYPMEETE
jgi:hypothetical protein